MKANSILLNKKDNVVTVTCNIKKGETIVYTKDGKISTITATTDIPAWNKAAITSIKKDNHVIKYGEIIGSAMENIDIGNYVSHLNIKSLPRDYIKEMNIRRNQ